MKIKYRVITALILGGVISSNYIESEAGFKDWIHSILGIDELSDAEKESRVIAGSVLDITLNAGENIPSNLANNPNGYETIRVVTNGSKKLDSLDFMRLKDSLIPNIDLSQSSASSIPSKAFQQASHLISFKFPKDLTVISNYAFDRCLNLSGELQLPITLTEIGKDAFNQCGRLVGMINLPDSIIKLGTGAFKDCIGFNGTLKLPNGLKSIDNYAFSGCSKISGTLYLPESLESIGSYAFYKCSRFSGGLYIPDNVTSIGSSAFYQCLGFYGDLKLPSNIKVIGANAFYDCSGLKGNLYLPNTLNTIGENAFRRCTGFTGNLIIPDSVTNLESGAFKDCSGFNGTLKLPDNLTEINNSVFSGCRRLVGQLIIPSSVTIIGESAFSGCSGLNGDLILPSSLVEIGFSSFNGCIGFTGDLIIPDSVTNVRGNAFGRCSGFNGRLVLGNSVRDIGQYAFQYMDKVKGKLVIPPTVKTIGMGAFEGCENLSGDLFIPDSVTSIGGYAFEFCSNIDNIIVKTTSSDSSSNYRKAVIDGLPNSNQTIIEMPYNLNISGTWMENTRKTIGKPSVQINDGEAILNIPSPYMESKVTVTKDGKPYSLPINETPNNITLDYTKLGRYIFTELGEYTVHLEAYLGSISDITFTIKISDNVPPVLSLIVNTEDWAKSKTISVTVNDDKSGVKGILLPDGNFVAVSKIEYSVFENKEYVFKAMDNANNEASNSIIVSKIDNEGPTLDLSIVNKNEINYLKTEASDAGAGFDRVNIEGADYRDAIYKYELNRNGQHEVTAYDVLGNSTTKSIDVNVGLLSLRLSLDNYDLTNQDVNILASAIGPDSDFSYMVLPNGTKVYQKTATYQVSSNGLYSFGVMSNSGELIKRKINVSNIDKDAPTVRVEKSTDKEWSNIDVRINIIGEDT